MGNSRASGHALATLIASHQERNAQHSRHIEHASARAATTLRDALAHLAQAQQCLATMASDARAR